jgi:pyruvate dehydrogenase E2 component (dihydrolipoyllysine-residue acetyltransferase)
MPRLSDSMEEGTIVRWLKQDGDPVCKGEPLAEVETDKATVTFDADADGTLRILAAEGKTVRIGGVIASIGAGDGQPGERVENGRVKASPLARRTAREAGVDLRGVSGSGPGGRITKADVTAAAAEQAGVTAAEQADVTAAAAEQAGVTAAEQADVTAAAAEQAGVTAVAAEQGEATAAPPAPARGGKGVVTTVEPSRTQVQIAQRMAESKATIPDFTLHAEVAMEQAVELRTQLRRAARGADAVPSYNDIVVKACGVALREHPRANAAYRDGAFELYERVNVGIAVAADDSLIVPTLFDADRKSLLDIAREARTLAERVRSRQITPAELSGATFTVSNLGMYGIASFDAIINPPQAAILAVGEMREVPVVRDGQVVPGQRMSIALTCDHRILYGASSQIRSHSRRPWRRCALSSDPHVALLRIGSCVLAQHPPVAPLGATVLTRTTTKPAPMDRASRRSGRRAHARSRVPTSPGRRGGWAAVNRAAAGRSARTPRRCPAA